MHLMSVPLKSLIRDTETTREPSVEPFPYLGKFGEIIAMLEIEIWLHPL